MQRERVEYLVMILYSRVQHTAKCLGTRSLTKINQFKYQLPLTALQLYPIKTLYL